MKRTNTVHQRIATLSLSLIMVFSIEAQGQDLMANHYNVNQSGIFLNGFDVVSYFLEEVAKGKASISATHEGVEYWFENQDNKDIFLKNPEKFIPAYGGWCAYAMGESGEKVKIDPETYKFINGRLYLFYNYYFNNTLIDWNEDENNLRMKADNNWAKLLNN